MVSRRYVFKLPPPSCPFHLSLTHFTFSHRFISSPPSHYPPWSNPSRTSRKVSEKFPSWRDRYRTRRKWRFSMRSQESTERYRLTRSFATSGIPRFGSIIPNTRSFHVYASPPVPSHRDPHPTAFFAVCCEFELIETLSQRGINRTV